MKKILSFISKFSFKNLVTPLFKGFLRVFFSDRKVAFILRVSGYFLGIFRFASAVLGLLLIINLYDFEAGFSLQGFIDFMYAFYQTLVDNVNHALNKFNFSGSTAKTIINSTVNSAVSSVSDTVSNNTDNYDEYINKLKSFSKDNIPVNSVKKTYPVADESGGYLDDLFFWLMLSILGIFVIAVITTDNPIKTEVKNVFSGDGNRPSYIRDYIWNPVKRFFTGSPSNPQFGTPDNRPSGSTLPDSVNNNVSVPVAPEQSNIFTRFFNSLFRRNQNNMPTLPDAPNHTPYSLSETLSEYKKFFKSPSAPEVQESPLIGKGKGKSRDILFEVTNIDRDSAASRAIPLEIKFPTPADIEKGKYLDKLSEAFHKKYGDNPVVDAVIRNGRTDPAQSVQSVLDSVRERLNLPPRAFDPSKVELAASDSNLSNVPLDQPAIVQATEVEMMTNVDTGLSPDWSNFYNVKPTRVNIAEKTIQNIINSAPTPPLTDDGSSVSTADSIETALDQEDMLSNWD